MGQWRGRQLFVWVRRLARPTLSGAAVAVAVAEALTIGDMVIVPVVVTVVGEEDAEALGLKTPCATLSAAPAKRPSIAQRTRVEKRTRPEKKDCERMRVSVVLVSSVE